MMLPRRREIELLVLTAFAAVPLYFTATVGPIPLVLFHIVMAGTIIRVAMGKGPDLIPPALMRVLAMAYIVLYFVDLLITRSAIAASTRLVLFIAAYQPIESMRTNNLAQRLFTAALIFIASIATAVDITIVAFIIIFSYFMLRELMLVSHVETVRSIETEYHEPSSKRAAAFYLAGTAIVAAGLFPLLPRVRNPLVRGLGGGLTQTATGLSDSIDFNQQRSAPPDPTVVARVWMGRESIPFFTPLRLRGAIYDRYINNVWLPARGGSLRAVPERFGEFRIARATGFTRPATVQQRLILESRLLLPVGTVAVKGVPGLRSVRMPDIYNLAARGYRQGEPVNYEAVMALRSEPLVPPNLATTYVSPSPEVAAMAARIVGTTTDPRLQAVRIESYLLSNLQYFKRPEQLGRTMTVDDFLLRERRGHCEYFAAGMVTLLAARNIPARIVGGFYGGQLNPLTGYFVIRREDAHAWVEMWNGREWLTFDPTPVAERPGNSDKGLLSVYLSAMSESINYFWDRYILTYGLADQIALAVEVITRGRDTVSALKQKWDATTAAITFTRVVAAAAVITAIILIAVVIIRRRRGIPELLAQSLRRLGIEVSSSMTFEEALAELRTMHPQAARELEPLIALYEEERFSATRRRERIQSIRRKLAELQ